MPNTAEQTWAGHPGHVGAPSPSRGTPKPDAGTRQLHRLSFKHSFDVDTTETKPDFFGLEQSLDFPGKFWGRESVLKVRFLAEKKF